ncbi:hypothetical protein ANAPH2_00987 [Anaplasma phagocytophilum]|nr:hypothetical protein ANAPH2_00987 [Anaplasma phagocytophilum]
MIYNNLCDGFLLGISLEMGEIEEYSESLRRSFDKLSGALADRFEISSQNSTNSQLSELLSKVDELSARNAELEQELLNLKATCDEWKVTCSELIAKLDASIEVIRPILELEKN